MRLLKEQAPSTRQAIEDVLRHAERAREATLFAATVAEAEVISAIEQLFTVKGEAARQAEEARQVEGIRLAEAHAEADRKKKVACQAAKLVQAEAIAMDHQRAT
jgi:hypothetical protein